MNDFNSFALEIVKLVLKPGYLYGIGEDGELYRAEAKLPKAGETVVFPPMKMPKDGDANGD